MYVYMYVCVYVCTPELNVYLPLHLLGGPKHIQRSMSTAHIARETSKTVKSPPLPQCPGGSSSHVELSHVTSGALF